MVSVEERESVGAALQEFGKNMGKMASMISSDHHKQRPGDVYICTYAKSGTNLLRQIVYQVIVAAGGAPSFDPEGDKFENINDVVPALEFAPLANDDTDKTITTPRAFCTHSKKSQMNLSPEAGGRFIFGFRNVENIPSSMLDFVVEWNIPGMLKTDEEREIFYHAFVKMFLKMAGGTMASTESTDGLIGNWFNHTQEWTDEPRENLLVLSYEKVCKDIRGTAQGIAKFLNLEISEEGFDTIVHRCSRDYMLSEKFLVPFSGPWSGKPGSFVRAAGDTGFHAFKFDDAEKEESNKLLHETFGVKTYYELADVLLKKHATARE